MKIKNYMLELKTEMLNGGIELKVTSWLKSCPYLLNYFKSLLKSVRLLIIATLTMDTKHLKEVSEYLKSY